MGLGIALGAFLKCLFNRDFAGQVKELAIARKSRQVEASPEPPEKTVEAPPTPEKEENNNSDWAVISLLAELQKDGRFIDFMEEDLSHYDDEEIGSSVRTIHEGCQKALKRIISKEKIIDQDEESSYRVNKGFNTHHIKLNGKVSDNFPLKGTLVHPGWKVTDVKLGERSQHLDKIITPAEVEIE
ncbi:MAG: DUF2760 domain-containing protein [Planctomycetes bacterium]|nr:DUF2760 domain-containing protein [Planctomycetota bacterium]